MSSTIWTIAKYERKILFRSWFFRIFSALTLFMIFVFNMGEISAVGDQTWIYRAVPSNMPYLAIYLLNVGQAIIAAFLSSEFIKRDRKQDTTEVIYVRSMSNASYVLGKMWSILTIFLLVNVAALGLSLIFNALAADTHIDWQAFLYYPILLSVPTLIYIVGLSSLVMSIIRNQALTFVLLVGYILSSLIYLGSSYNYLFDYMAFYQPLFHSQITGFGDWETVWTLRGMYTCFGLGSLFLSILLLKRLPQSKIQNALSAVLALAFLGSGIYLGNQHLNRYYESLELPQEMIALNNQHLATAKIDIDRHEIMLTQQENGVRVEAKITGKTKAESKEYVFNLNPGLEVTSVQANGNPVGFEQKLQLLLVQFDSVVSKNITINLQVEYSGTIDENAMFIDIDENTKFTRPNNYIFDIGKRYAYLEPNFLLLPQEAKWYLQSGVGYSTESASWFRKDFIDYQLSVKTLPGLIPISAGQLQKIGEDTYTFERDFDLPHLSLSIGNYQKKSLRVDSVEFSVYHIEGHDYFNNAFPDIRDTLPSIILERLRDYERKIDLKYPFKDFSIVEVPGHFKSYDRTWTSVHQHNQAGFVYFPEKGLFSRLNDFNGYVKRIKRWNSGRNKTPEELQIVTLNRFIDRFFRFKDTEVRSTNTSTDVNESINPYYQFVQFYEMSNNLDSEDWPVLNRIFESYLRGSENADPEWVRRNSGSTQNELANMVLQEKSFAEILNLQENQQLIDNVIELKGETLFSIMEAKANTNRFRDFIGDVLLENRFQNLPLEDFNKKLQAEFEVDISNQMEKWFNETQLSKYRFSTPIAEKVLAGNKEMFQVTFKVTNEGSTEGVIKTTLRPDEDVEKLLYLAPAQTKEVFYLSIKEPTGVLINTLSSGNLPNRIEYNFEQVGKGTTKNATEKETIINESLVVTDAREIIIDNEDSEFDFTNFEEVSRLRKWIKPKEGDDFKYKGSRVWRPPLNWTATTNDKFFGDFIRSAFYIKAGDGSKQAQWKIPIEDPGRYDVYYHIYRDVSFRWDRNQNGSYQFIIPHQNGTDRPKIELT
ncbi:MAG: ABC transporter permease, partial [Bacteroidota bacterium]